MKIGLLIIATNKYTNFINKLIESADEYFCNNHEVTYFIFTNKDVSINSKRNYKILKIKHEDWPYITLKRYHYFSNYEKELQDMDYLFYSDVDMKFVAPIGDEILSDRVVTTHPGFYNKSHNQYTFETRRESMAFIQSNSSYKYYAGGFNGGSVNEFLKMSKTLKDNIESDLSRGIVAKWHDESHLNYYYNIITKPTLELSPSYCYAESWNLPFEKKILALDKNHKEYRT